MLMAAGLIFLAGCATEVMDDRKFNGNPPQADPEPGKTQVAKPVEDIPAPAPKDQRKAAPAPAYRPMEGSYSNEGVEVAPRRAPKGKAAAAKAAPAKGGVYVVKKGDTMGRIAARHKVTVAALRQANNRTAAQDRALQIGTKLVIPAGKAAMAPAKSGKKAAPAPVKSTGKKTPKLNADGTYTMVKGDTIPGVARKFGIRARALQAANNLSDEDTTKLQIGHKLVIPTGADAKSGRKPATVKVKKTAPAPEKKVEAPAQGEQTPALPPETAVDGTTPATAPAGQTETAPALPPEAAPMPAETAPAESATDFVSVAGFNSLEEFAAKYNTTVDEIIRLNPRIDRNAPIATFGMLYAPKAK